MAKPNPYRPFVPKPEQMALWPERSGNDVNGLGEAKRRRPSMVYWAPEPGDIPHGALQLWFYRQGDNPEAFAAERAKRQAVIEAPLPEVAVQAVEQSAEAWTAELSQFVERGECEQIGVAEMDPNWVIEGFEAPQSRVIVAGAQPARIAA